MAVQNWLILSLKWPNYSTYWSTRSVLRTFMQNLIAFCSQPEIVSDVISGTGSSKRNQLVIGRFKLPRFESRRGAEIITEYP